ncbi:MAG: chromosomal replication initiator protein DnaA [Lachnospiraceae bacterium]|nr:chromosomal replication initiator protein DnaA [Lachnospiraceae bacterium]
MEIIRQQWDNIKENIRLEYDITDIAFNIWVKPLKYGKCENNIVTIMIPNGKPEMLDYIRKNYTSCFQSALSDLLQENFNVIFVLEEDMKPEKNISYDHVAENDHSFAQKTNLNMKYRFENFIVGPNNTMAHSACLHVAESPGKDFNPLFIYGGSGLGKTHLMTSIGHYIVENSKLNVLYVTSEDFTNEVINSIRSSTMTNLRDKYRNIDVLLIDDIQFVIGKPSTQEEFFHTFNTLYQNGKTIVITSDKHPVHMKELDERFRSRFTSGLVVDIVPPAYETRVAILRKYSENFDYKIPNTVIDYIAENIKSNIRELEGAYNQVYAKSMLTQSGGGTIDLAAAKEILKDTISPDKPTVITPPMILKGISEYYHVDPEDITSKKRNAEIVLPRQIFMYLCREMTDITLKGVAALLDKKDHSTVLHGCNKISEEIKKDDEFRETIVAIKNKINTL